MDSKDFSEELTIWAKKHFGASFAFRPGQLETINDIVQTFFQGEKNLYLLEGPTGSGKSIIAMVVAGFLSQYELQGYILASDISLQTQYEKDIERLGMGWGCVKGMNNYTCSVNNEKFSLGECRMLNMSYDKAEELDCFESCGYLMNRKQAVQSSVAVLNYSYWLLQMNYTAPKMRAEDKRPPFDKRDFTICDEAHKVTDIVQNHFSPRFTTDLIDKVDKLIKFTKTKGIEISPEIQVAKTKQLLRKIQNEEANDKLFVTLKEMESILSRCSRSADTIKEAVKSKYSQHMKVPGEWRFALGVADWLKDIHCKVEDYNHIISQVGIDYMVKNPQGEDVVFNCLEESYMMNRYFHEQAGFKLMMTATMGNPKDYMKTVGAKKCVYKRIRSTFDFTKSPILFYPKRRMSMAHKEKNFPWMVKELEEIFLQHSGESGIVHTGSYETAGNVFNALNPAMRERVIPYSSSKEKNDAMDEFIREDGRILMGPTLLEGLDLFDDLSRFQVFLKVPFPSLGDKFVQAKLNQGQGWYDWKTCIQVLQGTGRSVRSEKDYAVTYFLDGCLGDLFRRTRTSFPEEFQNRIVVTIK